MKIVNYYMLVLLVFFTSNLIQAQGSINKNTRNGCSGIPCPVSCQSALCPIDFSCPAATGPCAIFSCLNVTQSATFGTLTTSCEKISGNLTVGGSVNIKGDAIIENNLNALGDECLSGTLGVGGNVSVGCNELVQGSLTVNSGTIINGPLTVNGPETVNGSVVVTGNETVGQNLLVEGTGTINGLLTAQGGLLVFNGETINSGGLIILSGGANITGDVQIIGNETVDDLDILGNLTVVENASFNGCSTTVNGTLITNGPVIMNRGLTIASGNETITSGNLTLTNGNLTVGGLSQFNGLVTITNGATINNGLTVFGGETIATGNLTVANCGNVIIGGNLTVAGPIIGNSATTLASLTITDDTNSTSPTTGALVVAGGVGIGKDLWLGGGQFFQNTIDEGADPTTLAPLNYYEEVCFPMIFEFNVVPTTTVTVQAVRIGNLVNLIIPTIFAGAGFGTVNSITQIPERLRPACTIRGAASTIVNNVSQLGEFEVDPSGDIIFGIPGAALGPQPFTSSGFTQVDINTITYNRLGCGCIS